VKRLRFSTDQRIITGVGNTGKNTATKEEQKMKWKMNGIEFEGTPLEFLQTIKQEVEEKMETTTEPKEESKPKRHYHRKFRHGAKKGHYHKWMPAEDNIIKSNWLTKGQGVTRRKMLSNNRRIAKILGRTYEACRNRYELLVRLSKKAIEYKVKRANLI